MYALITKIIDKILQWLGYKIYWSICGLYNNLCKNVKQLKGKCVSSHIEQSIDKLVCFVCPV